VRLVKGKNAAAGADIPMAARPGQVPKWARLVFLASLVLALSGAGLWKVWLLYWLLPLVTVMPAIVRWGAICEHEYNRLGDDVFGTTPIIIQPWYEQLLMPMLNFGMHTYHHLFPAVTFSQLPEVHRVFQEAGLVDESKVFHASRAYLRFLLGSVQGRSEAVLTVSKTV
jgi:fatty acid desaturase